MTPTTPAVSDEIWDQIPTRRLPRGRVFGSLAGILALVTVALVLQHIGLASPSLSTRGSGGTWGEGKRTFSTYVDVTNDGRFPVNLDRLALSAPWLKLGKVSVEPPNDVIDGAAHKGQPLPVTLQPGQSVSVVFAATVTDCTAIRRSGSDVTFDATSPMSTRTIRVDMRAWADREYPLGDRNRNESSGSTYAVQGPSVPWPVAWASSGCSMPVPTS